MTRIRIGIDTGGTFTDLLAVADDGAEYVVKVPSTPKDPARSFISAVQGLNSLHGVDLSTVEILLHGTTVGINALLQGKCPPVGLITTDGFGDILEIARQTVPGERGSIYTWVKPERIVPRSRVRETPGRLDARGNEIVPLDLDALRETVRWFLAAGIQNVAISFINSYANPAHERQARDLIATEFPDMTATISTDTLPEFREYERTIATVMNALLKSILAGYLKGIEDDIANDGLKAPLFIMKSSGGVTTAKRAAQQPVLSALSGPAAGALGLANAGLAAGYKNVITFDMGGTSSDVSLIEDGKAHISQETMIDVYPLRVPTIDVISVGAGGGSIAWVAPGGFPRVGPQSAGADPGPACYGRGGTEATITDANLLLGRLGTELAGGAVRLDRVRSEDVIARFAGEINLEPVATANGILEIANFKMADALRQISVARGRDPRLFALVAGGGAGPLHAVRLAEILAIPVVVIPPTPGVGCATGLLVSDVQEDAVVTAITKEDDADLGLLAGRFETLEAQVADRLVAQGFARESIELRRSADIRYQGQRTELTVGAPNGAFERPAFAEMIHNFHEAYKASFDYNYEGEQKTELVNLRVTGVVRLPKFEPQAVSLAEGIGSDPVPAATRRVYFGDAGWLQTGIYNRPDLKAGQRVLGPAIVDQYDSTTVVLPGHQCEVHATGSLLITRA